MELDPTTMRQAIEAASAELAVIQAKARLFDVLSERVASGAWRVKQSEVAPFIPGVGVTITTTGERITGATLAEAVRLAMEAEGER